MEKLYDSIFEHIADGIRYARAKHIKANAIILDKGIAITNDLYFEKDSTHIQHIKPMIMGLEIEYEENLKNNFGCNFIIETKTNEEEPRTLSDYTIEELLDEIKRRIS